MAENEINEELRAHVTRVGFDLTLGKTHVAALVYVDQMLKRRTYLRTPMSGPYRHAFSNSVMGVRGLEDRGLVVHLRPDRALRQRYQHNGGDIPPRLVYQITKAGRLVIALLKEAGIYDEYLASLPVLTEAKEAG